MKNINLSVDEATLEKVQRLAQSQNTSIAALLNDEKQKGHKKGSNQTFPLIPLPLSFFADSRTPDTHSLSLPSTLFSALIFLQPEMAERSVVGTRA
jgi:hypothetical protein